MAPTGMMWLTELHGGLPSYNRPVWRDIRVQAEVQVKARDTCKMQKGTNSPGVRLRRDTWALMRHSCFQTWIMRWKHRFYLGTGRAAYIEKGMDIGGRWSWPWVWLIYHHCPLASIIHFLSCKNTLPKLSKASANHCLGVEMEDLTIFRRPSGFSFPSRGGSVLVNI